MSDASATFSINLEADPANIVAAGDSIQELKRKADASIASVSSMRDKLRDLKGTSAEVVNIKQQLNARLQAEQTNLASAALATVKAGTSLRALQVESRNAAKAATEAAKAQKGMGDVLDSVGGPLGRVKDKLSGLGELFEGTNAGMVAIGAGAAAAVAGVVLFTGAVVAATIALSKFAIAEGDANRSLALSRQFIAGSAADSARMGDQIDQLRQKIPLTTAEFSKLYGGIRASFDGTYASGEAIKNIVTTVGAASAAAGDQVASKLQAIAEQGKNVGRFGLDLGRNGSKGELAGTGVSGEDVAKHLAENTNVSLEKARASLRAHTVDYVQGIKAFTQASKDAFGEINAAKLLSIDNVVNKFHDDLSSLTKGFDMKPILEPVSKIANLFSVTTPTGYALREMFTSLGRVLGNVAQSSAPMVEVAIKTIVLEALLLRNELLRLEISFKQSFGSTAADRAQRIEGIITATKVAVGALGVTVLGITTALATGAAVAALWAAPFVLAYQAAKGVYDYANRTAGVRSGGGKQIDMGAKADLVGPGVSSGGAMITAPANADGGVVARPAPGEVFASVAPGERIVPNGPDSGSGRRGGAGSISITVPITIHASGSNGREVAQSVQSSGIVAQLTKAIEDALKSAGVPTQTLVTG